ncbi:MAG: lamin tail domain-containing protein [Bacteroidales bacterium]|nr:lamin tail domain-containing protein [Bacteroidales bacterium]
MRKIILLVMMIPGMVYAQVISEDFESGLPKNWIQSPAGRWETDSLHNISGIFSLHHSFDNPESGCDRIGTMIDGLQPSACETTWGLKVKHSYNPSSSNNWSFFLMSDEPPSGMVTGGTVSGYALGVNLSGYNDTLSLWKIVNGDASVLVSASLNWQNDIGVDSAASLTVKRTIEGNWEVFIADETGSQVLIGTGADPDLFYSGWTGIMYEYSSSQDRKLWIDDIIIEGYIEVDNEAPGVDTAYFSGNHTLTLQFNESLANNPSTESCTLMPGYIVPEYVMASDGSYLLEFQTALPNKMYYELEIRNVCDLSGNCCDIVIDSILLAIAEWGDIIISEIMIDPDPPAQLPPYEYLELYNISRFDLNIEGFKIQIGDDNYIINGGYIKSGELLLLANESDISSFTCYGKVLCTEGKFYLDNSCDRLVLFSSAGNVIHGIDYDVDWYKNQLKKYGGWSLEIIDPAYPFSGQVNWSESNDRMGGTPGKINSVNGFNPDLERPLLINIFPVTGKDIHLAFSETMDVKVTEPGSWSFTGNMAGKLSLADPLIKSVNIELVDSMEVGTIYEISEEGNITDQAGNSLIIIDKRFGLPVITEKNDILFNEILFDPLPGGAEFIELFNRSDKIVDLSDHFIVSYNSETSDTGKIVWLSEEHRCLMPGDYFVITTDKEALVNDYINCEPDRIYELGTLPAMPKKGGGLLLFNRSLVLIDKMIYSEDMHFSLLTVTGGVSLERIDTAKPGTDKNNWRSASAMSGYATPGTVNSCGNGSDDVVSNEVMTFSSRKISPDNDGWEDFLEIRLSLPGEDNILEIEIFNDMGYPVRSLAKNLTSGHSSMILWDGCDNWGYPVREGIYIICSKIISPGRQPEVLKGVCAVVYY